MSTDVKFVPPPLPAHHVSRKNSVFGTVAKWLDHNDIVCCFAYQNSGKTIAIAEFVSQHPWNCFWNTLRPDSDYSHRSVDNLLNDLAVFLKTDSAHPQHICKLLVEHCESEPLLIVLDNSNCIGDLSSIEFLIQAASSSTLLKVILLATDDVDFLTNLRTKTKSCEKLVGFTKLEAETFFEHSIGALSDFQKRAIEILVGKYDGHIGLLRICVPRIASLKSEEEFKGFVSELVVSEGDAEQFYTALVKRFKDSLSDSAFELCRRLTIAIRPFRKVLGKFLSRAKEEFFV